MGLNYQAQGTTQCMCQATHEGGWSQIVANNFASLSLTVGPTLTCTLISHICLNPSAQNFLYMGCWEPFYKPFRQSIEHSLCSQQYCHPQAWWSHFGHSESALLNIHVLDPLSQDLSNSRIENQVVHILLAISPLCLISIPSLCFRPIPLLCQ